MGEQLPLWNEGCAREASPGVRQRSVNSIGIKEWVAVLQSDGERAHRGWHQLAVLIVCVLASPYSCSIPQRQLTRALWHAPSSQLSISRHELMPLIARLVAVRSLVALVVPDEPNTLHAMWVGLELAHKHSHRRVAQELIGFVSARETSESATGSGSVLSGAPYSSRDVGC